MTVEELMAILSAADRSTLALEPDIRERVLSNPVTAELVRSIKTLGDSFRGEPIPQIPYSTFMLYDRCGDRTVYEMGPQGYFPRRGRLAAFSILSWLYERPEDLEALCDIIWAICDEYTWSLPAHIPAEGFSSRLECGQYTVDLFAAETGQALAETAFLLGDRLPLLIRRRIALLLEERIFSRVMEEDFWWMSCSNNWAAVCAGSVGMAAIYALEDSDRLAAILARLLPSMDSFLGGFSEDGACLEGLGYWNYGFGYFVAFAELMERRSAGAVRLLDRPLVERIARFQSRCFFEGGRTVSFSDGASRSSWSPGLTGMLASRFDGINLPDASVMFRDAAADHCFRYSSLLRDLIWAPRSLEKAQEGDRCCLFPSAQWYVNSGGRGVGFAAKGGNNEEPHNHNDVGTFLIYVRGQQLLADLGAGVYTREYFGPQRYDNFICGSQGHSVPMVDGQLQQAGAGYAAADFAIDEGGLSMDLAPAYGYAPLRSLRRSLRFSAETGITRLEDRFTLGEGSHEITERFIVTGAVEMADNVLIVENEGVRLAIDYDGNTFTAEVREVSMADHGGRTIPGLRTVDLLASVSGEFSARFSFRPL